MRTVDAEALIAKECGCERLIGRVRRGCATHAAHRLFYDQAAD